MSTPFLAQAQAAYQAYGQITDFKNYQGLPMPAWDDLPPKIKEAWIAATKHTIEMERLHLKPVLELLQQVKSLEFSPAE